MKLASLLAQPAALSDLRHLPVDDRSFFESWDKPENPAMAGEHSATLSTKSKSRKKTVTSVREHAELVMHFTLLLHADPDLKWAFAEPTEGAPIPQLELEVEGHTQAFTPVYELKPSPARLRKIRVTAGSPPPLLLTTELTPGMQAICRERRLCAMDLNGRTLLRAPGLLVDRAALPGRVYKHEVEPRNIFAGKSARILRTLLTDSTRLWSQGDVVTRTHASAGLVSRIAQHLIAQGHAERTAHRDLRVKDLDGLMNEWARTDRFATRTKAAACFAIEERSPLEVAHSLRAWAKAQNVSIAFTGSFAAGLRHPETVNSGSDTQEDGGLCAYLSVMPDVAVLEQLDLDGELDSAEAGAPKSGRLWLYVPDEEGVFLETQPSFRYVSILQQHLDLDLPLVSDAQMYLDLLGMSPKSSHQARTLRGWEGFCTGSGKV